MEPLIFWIMNLFRLSFEALVSRISLLPRLVCRSSGLWSAVSLIVLGTCLFHTKTLVCQGSRVRKLSKLSRPQLRWSKYRQSSSWSCRRRRRRRSQPVRRTRSKLWRSILSCPALKILDPSWKRKSSGKNMKDLRVQSRCKFGRASFWKCTARRSPEGSGLKRGLVPPFCRTHLRVGWKLSLRAPDL